MGEPNIKSEEFYEGWEGCSHEEPIAGPMDNHSQAKKLVKTNVILRATEDEDDETIGRIRTKSKRSRVSSRASQRSNKSPSGSPTKSPGKLTKKNLAKTMTTIHKTRSAIDLNSNLSVGSNQKGAKSGIYPRTGTLKMRSTTR